ncbi:hypothetical protein ACRE_001070 [Hapsidospora chrysogenum ATCC 11550]|uniref:MOZ protein represents a chromatin-associated acetyltransferase n=1 Tax=Hapsidospora chrysogenum (strain ATCC 11550 / CBS 779.69 / DSM 880 / IAM 14645 / JCM 23072 / IMI 49137) TaxID=857340 RepID=A0A086TIC4_HAPC1|nr:hypothetical protein ACRE_001070 [Hapsidospora chrysogenum ATCC 11550]
MASTRSRVAVLGWRALRTTTRQGFISRTDFVPIGGITSSGRWNSSFAPRHGKAVAPEEVPGEKPLPPPSAGKDVKPDGTKEGNSTVKSMVPTEPPPTAEPTPEEKPPAQANSNTSSSSSSSSESTQTEESEPAPDDSKQGRSLKDVLLRMDPPPGGKTRQQLQHMTPPPYVHHFDSYSLVKQLQDGGYTQAQAITAMKAIRALLAQNLDRAQESLVSKSDVENESYLFSAACSELGQEIKNNRRLRDEQIRQQRTHLQHEVDILTQSLNQEASTLNDNVRGMFNDRRMAVREEQKTADSAVQQINYKISTSLVSDSKSEIEGVRWILIRRSALGIFFMAMLTLGTVRYATYLLNERQKEAERKKEEAELVRKEAGKRDDTAAADAAAILAAN